MVSAVMASLGVYFRAKGKSLEAKGHLPADVEEQQGWRTGFLCCTAAQAL